MSQAKKTTAGPKRTPGRGTPKSPPPHLHQKTDPRVFVFGSNRVGIHGAGAADYAARDLDAKHGVGEGLTGRAYALPTCLAPGIPLTLDQVRVHVQRFMAFAVTRPDLRFFVSAIGTGIAGFREDEIALLFDGAPLNCDLPPGWREAHVEHLEAEASRSASRTPSR